MCRSCLYSAVIFNSKLDYWLGLGSGRDWVVVVSNCTMGLFWRTEFDPVLLETVNTVNVLVDALSQIKATCLINVSIRRPPWQLLQKGNSEIERHHSIYSVSCLGFASCAMSGSK